jgi:hypothetical protein
MELTEIWRDSVHWIHLALDSDQWRALVSTLIDLRVPKKAGNFLTSSATISFSISLLHEEIRKFPVTGVCN